MALARAYRDVPGLTEIYVADLDRIMHGGALSGTVAPLLAVGVPCMVDAGLSAIDDAVAALGAGVARVVVGLETLSSFHSLDQVIRVVGAERVVFSLDLRGAHAVARPGAEFAHLAPVELTRRAVESGACAVLLLDLARVGQATGPALPLVLQVRSAFPDIELLVGGGIRGSSDLAALAAAGCDGALVGTALHDGRITAGPK
jgi:phosphoribosylformimino-5-aminoimidazole carboxamide ribotide isomerase